MSKEKAALPNLWLMDPQLTSRMAGESSLSSQGYVVSAFAQSCELLEQAQLQAPDLILLDAVAQNAEAIQICSQLRLVPVTRSTPIIFMVDLDDLETMGQALTVGATDFVTKPINWIILNHRLRYILQQATHTRSSPNASVQDNIDALTGLPNRNAFLQGLDEYIRIAAHTQQLAAALFISVDNMKSILKVQGEVILEPIMRAVVLRLKKSVRGSDLVFGVDPEKKPLISRYNEDTFSLLLGDLKQITDPAIVARRLLEVLQEPIQLADIMVNLVISIGIAVYPNDDQQLDGLRQKGDKALYQAKSIGGNNFQFYDDAMNACAAESRIIEQGLRAAIEHNRLSLLYQPIGDMRDNKIIAIEALLRFQHPDLGMIAPRTFIPIAEAAGLLFDIEQWTIQQGLMQLQKMHASGWDGQLMLNITTAHLLDEEMPTFIEGQLKQYDIEGSRLVFEIDYAKIQSQMPQIQAMAKTYQELKIQFALERVGLKPLTLADLMGLPWTMLKIDRQLVADVTENSIHAKIVKGLVQLAKSMDMKTGAVGIESDLQLGSLRNVGCDFYQGFYLGAPQTASALIK